MNIPSKLMNFALKMMSFVIKMMNIPLKTMSFVLKMRDLGAARPQTTFPGHSLEWSLNGANNGGHCGTGGGHAHAGAECHN